MEQAAKLLAEEIAEKMAGKQNVNEMEGMMRELVKGAANLAMRQAIEQGEETYGKIDIACACGEQAQFVSKRSAVLWTLFGKVTYRRRYYLCCVCHQGASLGVAVIPPTYGGGSHQNAFFAPNCGKITANPRELSRTITTGSEVWDCARTDHANLGESVSTLKVKCLQKKQGFFIMHINQNSQPLSFILNAWQVV